MKFVFVMDTLDGVAPDKDTTFGFVESAVAFGHDCDHCLIHQVEFVGGDVTAVVRKLDYAPDGLSLVGEPRRLPLEQVDAVFIRKDPPFDAAYSYASLLLELLRGRTVMLNDPRGLREANEKLYALCFAEHMPKTIVTNDRRAIHDFVAEVGGKAVIKPLDGAGGFGVLALRSDDSNVKAIVDLLTLEGARLAMVQQYIEAISEGDKRVLVLDGEPLGAVMRRPTGGDMRANIHVGAEVTSTELTARELQVVEAMAPRLRADGLVFVGLDLIGEQLTEVNVTSPTGIRELSRLCGQRKSDDVIRWVERQVTALAK